MAVTEAKRFITLDGESDVPTSDFLNVSDSSVYNTSAGKAAEMRDSLKGAVESKAGATSNRLLATAASSSSVTVLRAARDGNLSKENFENLSTADRDKIADKLFTGYAPARNAFKALGPTCYNKIFASKTNKRGLNPKTNGRNSKTGACGVSEMAGMLDKMTAGKYSVDIQDSGSSKDLLVGVVNRSAEIGLPNTFSGLLSTIKDPQMAKRAGYDVVIAAAGRKDMWTFMDVANTSVGPELSTVSPGVSESVMKGFAIPAEVSEKDLSAYSGEFSNSMDRVDSKWKYSPTDSSGSLISTAKLDSGNEDTKEMFSCLSRDNSTTTPGAPVAFPSTDSTIFTALSLGEGNTKSSLAVRSSSYPFVGNGIGSLPDATTAVSKVSSKFSGAVGDLIAA